jgi:hypothetical protein
MALRRGAGDSDRIQFYAECLEARRAGQIEEGPIAATNIKHSFQSLFLGESQDEFELGFGRRVVLPAASFLRRRARSQRIVDRKNEIRIPRSNEG